MLGVDLDPATLTQQLGSHPTDDGVRFAIHAPRAAAVSVIGDFNDWDDHTHPLSRTPDGSWSTLVPGLGTGELYQYAIRAPDGQRLVKSDPFARHTQIQPQRSSIVWESSHTWDDHAWMNRRAEAAPHAEPMSIYEVHLGSWRHARSYADLATELVAYVEHLGFTHVEFMPLTEHPFIGSWGYQGSGYFAPTSRYGSPDDLKALIDAFHQAGIGVILDWVPGHFCTDAWALGAFDGTPVFEDDTSAAHPEWGTYYFDYTKPFVRAFLIASALSWLEEFHVDGIRVDAVATVLERPDAADFLRELNTLCYLRNPGIAMIAEDSSTYPGVTRPADHGGLGFGFKWNLGWMHDTLRYLEFDPLHRRHVHDDLTRTFGYATAENYLLALSHDEAVHAKGSLVGKMFGRREERLDELRAYLAFQWAHPGKHLLFMGGEFAQAREWSYRRALDWALLDDPEHAAVSEFVRDLNRHYRELPALWRHEYDPAMFALVVDDPDRNIVAFTRSAPGERTILCLSSFSGIDHAGVAVPVGGDWSVLLSTRAIDPPRRDGVHLVLTVPARSTVWLGSDHE